MRMHCIKLGSSGWRCAAFFIVWHAGYFKLALIALTSTN